MEYALWFWTTTPKSPCYNLCWLISIEVLNKLCIFVIEKYGKWVLFIISFAVVVAAL